MADQYQALVKKALRAGWTIRRPGRSSGHLQLRCPCGQHLAVSGKSPQSKGRALANLTGSLRACEATREALG